MQLQIAAMLLHADSDVGKMKQWGCCLLLFHFLVRCFLYLLICGTYSYLYGGHVLRMDSDLRPIGYLLVITYLRGLRPASAAAAAHAPWRAAHHVLRPTLQPGQMGNGREEPLLELGLGQLWKEGRLGRGHLEALVSELVVWIPIGLSRA